MTVLRYDLDQIEQRAELMARVPTVQALPRRNVYGAAPGIIAFGDFVDLLVQPADYKEVITHCHEAQVFPLYHQHASWARPGEMKWNQDGLSYCWAWSAVASMMDCRAREGKRVPLLSPVSLGWTVKWNNAGNYLQSGIDGLKERGVCEMTFTPDQHSRTYRNYKAGWEENALQYRLSEAWDADNGSQSKMIQHAISILATGTPGYIAYNWWGHALEVVGVRWDETQKYNLVWVIRNSHNEDDVIELTGTKGVPDELYGLRATLN